MSAYLRARLSKTSAAQQNQRYRAARVSKRSNLALGIQPQGTLWHIIARQAPLAEDAGHQKDRQHEQEGREGPANQPPHPQQAENDHDQEDPEKLTR